jgi:hypothetical protein
MSNGASEINGLHRARAEAASYYRLRFVEEAFRARLGAIERALPPGSNVVDFGCNDGRVARHLIDRGIARHVAAFDVVDLIGDPSPGLTFERLDLVSGDLSALPSSVDAVLLLNVVHHLVAHSRAIAKRVIDKALTMAPIVLVEMGSYSESGPWDWRREYERYWRDDSEMGDDLFDSASHRRELLRYPAQNGGWRVLWQLGQQAPTATADHYRLLGRYRRTVSSVPEMKRLVAVADEQDGRDRFGLGLGDLCADVVFLLLQAADGSRYWAKRWLGERAWVAGATLAIETALARLGRSDLSLAVDVDRDAGLIYRFDDELLSSRAIVHQWDMARFFDPAECVEIRRFSSTILAPEGLPVRALGDLTDFQTARTSQGLTFLDFEPAPHLLGR